jgi:hypothetical protein
MYRGRGPGKCGRKTLVSALVRVDFSSLDDGSADG